MRAGERRLSRLVEAELAHLCLRGGDRLLQRVLLLERLVARLRGGCELLLHLLGLLREGLCPHLGLLERRLLRLDLGRRVAQLALQILDPLARSGRAHADVRLVLLAPRLDLARHGAVRSLGRRRRLERLCVLLLRLGLRRLELLDRVGVAVGGGGVARDGVAPLLERGGRLDEVLGRLVLLLLERLDRVARPALLCLGHLSSILAQRGVLRLGVGECLL
mmetsp:Transcript_49043/g.158915  ORF Transcript_49043/g.158915 Transcript_49043/m.158915 type:complete len:220 (-) Transcript_49043:859-1518(-)